jgi:hypothetical protein
MLLIFLYNMIFVNKTPAIGATLLRCLMFLQHFAAVWVKINCRKIMWK